MPAVAGCADETRLIYAEDPGDPWQDAGPSDQAPVTAVPEPYSMPFQALLPQPVQWASQVVHITSARLERGLDERVLDPGRSYALLELDITNGGSGETDYRTRRTWDLRLADGNRIAPESSLDVLIVAGDTAHTSLVYLVDEGTTLAGSSLVLEGEERGSLTPESIPLDQPHAGTQRRLVQLEGMTIEPPSGLFESFRIEIDSAELGLNDRTHGVRAPLDTQLLTLDVTATCLTGFQNGSWGTDDARLLVDGHAYEADEYHGDVLDIGTSRRFHLRFVLPSGGQQLGLTFGVGYDSDTEQHVTQRVDIDLAGSELID